MTKIISKIKETKGLKAAKEQLSQVLGAINSAKKELEGINKAINQHNRDEISAKTNLDLANNKVIEAEKELEMVSKHLSVKKGELSSFNSAIEKQSRLYEEKDKELSRLFESIDGAKKNHSNRLIDLEKHYRSVCDELERDNIKLQSDKQTLLNEITGFKGDLDKAQKDIEAKKKEFQELEDQLKKGGEMIMFNFNQSIKFKDELASLEQEVAQVKVRQAEAMHEFDIKNAKLNEVKKDLSMAEAKLEQKQNSILALVKREDRIKALAEKVKGYYKKVGLELTDLD